jgi:rubrerythrin
MRPVDFSKLTLRDTLDLAILVEEEAKDRYEEFVHQMVLHRNKGAACFFRLMIHFESAHEGALLERRCRLFGNEPATVGREMISDVEAPELHEVRASMTEREALEIALRAEKRAFAFFDAAAQAVDDPEIASLLIELRMEEVDHQWRIKERMKQVAAQPGIGFDFQDGAVAD